MKVALVLGQCDSEEVEHLACYFSNKFDSHQRNYSTIEQENRQAKVNSELKTELKIDAAVT